MIKKSWKKIVRKKDKSWKVDIYSGIKGERLHSHTTLSGAILIKEKFVGEEVLLF